MSKLYNLLVPILQRKVPLYRKCTSYYNRSLESGVAAASQRVLSALTLDEEETIAENPNPSQLSSVRTTGDDDSTGQEENNVDIVHKKKRFSGKVRSECWDKAEQVPGRHPKRWRKDPYGNIVCKEHSYGYGLTCFQFDHIDPISGTGESTLSNCQVLAAYLNLFKRNLKPTEEEMKGRSYHKEYTDDELDSIEANAFGNVLKPGYVNFECCYYTRDQIKNMAGINWMERTKACDSLTEEILVKYALDHGLNAKPHVPTRLVPSVRKSSSNKRQHHPLDSRSTLQ